MKIVITIITLFTILTSIATELESKFHSDHSHEDVHSEILLLQTSKYFESEQTNTNNDLPLEFSHHFHCSNICIALVLNNDININQISYPLLLLVFHPSILTPQDNISLLYRPPIA